MLESRRSPELAVLVSKYGGQPVIAPVLREVPLGDNRAALDFLAALQRGEYDIVVLETGVGTRMLVEVGEPNYGRERIIAALGAVRLVARGPKPVAALRELGITPWLTAPSPNTWREIVAAFDNHAPDACAGARIAVLEHGSAVPELIDALRARGAIATPVPIYKWALPEDLTPARQAVRAIVTDQIDVVMLTASIQLVHLLRVAGDIGLEREVKAGLRRTVIASIGPVTSDEVRRHGLQVDLEPTQPKMGFLVKEAAEKSGALLQAKTGGTDNRD